MILSMGSCLRMFRNAGTWRTAPERDLEHKEPTVETSHNLDPVRVIRCQNCGCVLAGVIRDTATRSLYLEPAEDQSRVEVVVAGRRRARCNRCNGRTFLDPAVGTMFPSDALVDNNEILRMLTTEAGIGKSAQHGQSVGSENRSFPVRPLRGTAS